MSEGLFDKFIVSKRDGSPVDPKAEYFVLRLDNDRDAVTAVLTWCNLKGNQKLYEDILHHVWDKQDKERGE
jgi:hypothetical protein